MADENQNPDKKKQGQYGTGSQGTQEREENVTGSSGVQNRQGQNINQGSTTGQKGGPGMGQPNQQRQGNMGQQGQRQGQDLNKNKTSGGFGGSEESEEE